MNARERAQLIEAVTTAHRERSASGKLRSAPAWHDLDPEGRRAAYTATCLLRRLEAAIDPEGLSSTALAVLARISPPERNP